MATIGATFATAFEVIITFVWVYPEVPSRSPAAVNGTFSVNADSRLVLLQC